LTDTILRPARARALARWGRHAVMLTPLILAGIAILTWGSVALAIAWFAVSRIAYIGFAAVSLKRAPRPEDAMPLDAREAAWRRFRDRASWLMDNDAVALCTLIVKTWGTFDVGMQWWVAIVAGVGLCIVGISVKLWAGAHLPEGSYHWRDFFVHEEKTFSASGPYKLFANPMYTLGYAHAYGVALAWLSFPGLLAAAFAQATILALNAFVEQPHFRRTHER
jgi:protein-S-isoprenylcysteine O-methyltransferase Ste14